MLRNQLEGPLRPSYLSASARVTSFIQAFIPRIASTSYIFFCPSSILVFTSAHLTNRRTVLLWFYIFTVISVYTYSFIEYRTQAFKVIHLSDRYRSNLGATIMWPITGQSVFLKLYLQPPRDPSPSLVCESSVSCYPSTTLSPQTETSTWC